MIQCVFEWMEPANCAVPGWMVRERGSRARWSATPTWFGRRGFRCTFRGLGRQLAHRPWPALTLPDAENAPVYHFSFWFGLYRVLFQVHGKLKTWPLEVKLPVKVFISVISEGVRRKLTKPVVEIRGELCPRKPLGLQEFKKYILFKL